MLNAKIKKQGFVSEGGQNWKVTDFLVQLGIDGDARAKRKANIGRREYDEQRSLTALLGHRDHGIMANQAGYEGQRAGPQVLYHSRHECPSQGLFKRSAGRRVLCFVAVRDDDIGDPLLSEANGGENHTMD